MTKNRRLLVQVVTGIGIAASAARIDAAEFPRHIKAGDHRLMLNGWGTRTKTFLQLYVAGLYLAQPHEDPEKIASADEPMAIRIKITSRFVSQAKFVDSLTEGFQRSTRGNLAPIQLQIDKFRSCFQEPITQGDVFDMVFLPKHGVIVNKNGRFKGMVEGAGFKDALFNIWLSNDPVDEKLKQAMLDRRTARDE